LFPFLEIIIILLRLTFSFFSLWFPFLYSVLFAAAMMSAKMALPTANNATFAAIVHARTKRFMPTTPTAVANSKSKNPF
jgi:hypothetical protein